MEEFKWTVTIGQEEPDYSQSSWSKQWWERKEMWKIENTNYINFELTNEEVFYNKKKLLRTQIPYGLNRERELVVGIGSVINYFHKNAEDWNEDEAQRRY